MKNDIHTRFHSFRMFDSSNMCVCVCCSPIFPSQITTCSLWWWSLLEDDIIQTNMIAIITMAHSHLEAAQEHYYEIVSWTTRDVAAGAAITTMSSWEKQKQHVYTSMNEDRDMCILHSKIPFAH